MPFGWFSQVAHGSPPAPIPGTARRSNRCAIPRLVFAARSGLRFYDSADNFLHKRVLEDAKVADSVMAVEGGNEALEFLEGSTPPPDLIFLDVNMPGMNGWEFLEEYSKLDEQHKGSIVVVMLTTSLNPADEERARSILEINDFMNKPLTAEGLQAIVDKHLHGDDASNLQTAPLDA